MSMLNGNLDTFSSNTSRSGAQHRLSALKHLAVLKFEFSVRVQSSHIGNKLRSLRYRRTLHRQALQLHRLNRHRQTQKARNQTRPSWSRHRRRSCKMTTTTWVSTTTWVTITTWVTTTQSMSSQTKPFRTARRSEKKNRQASTSRIAIIRRATYRQHRRHRRAHRHHIARAA